MLPLQDPEDLAHRRRPTQEATLTVVPAAHPVGREVLKRLVDVVVASVALVVLFPVFVVLGLAVLIGSGRPLLFRQERLGRHGEPFHLLKIRTMAVGSGSVEELAKRVARDLAGASQPLDGSYKPDLAERVTPIGRWLRRFSLDELPQLWNVLRGQMSLVGPRPALQVEHDLFPRHAWRRLLVKPGLTGLWQVSGRNLLDTRDMLELDLRYVRERSVWLDVRILARTPLAALRGDGAR